MRRPYRIRRSGPRRRALEARPRRLFFAGILIIAASFLSCDSTEAGDGAGGDSTRYDPGKPANVTSNPTIPAGCLNPSSLVYRGAFRLPDRAEGAPDERSWEYGGQALAFYPGGDPQGADDGYPGSLFGTGHDQTNFVSEISIPAPVVSKNPAQLPTAAVLQDFKDVRGSLFRTLNELPRVGMECLPGQSGMPGDKLALCWGQHFQEEPGTTNIASHAWCGLDLSRPDTRGAWWIGGESVYSVNGYLFSIPPEWAAAHVNGMSLATGRFRDGGWSGMGPQMYAIAPWKSGNPPPGGTRLEAIPLLRYSHTRGDDATNNRLSYYQHSDEWEGGAWITSGSGAAVVFIGTKGSGYLWYGSRSPDGNGKPCVDVDITDMTTCYTPDGNPCPSSLTQRCAGYDPSSRGWWSSRFDAEMLFYSPADLAAVAEGRMKPYEPQPYAVIDIDSSLILKATVEQANLGSGDQRRYRLGEAAYDRAGRRLYVIERFADGAKPVVHVWSVE